MLNENLTKTVISITLVLVYLIFFEYIIYSVLHKKQPLKQFNTINENNNFLQNKYATKKGYVCCVFYFKFSNSSSIRIRIVALGKNNGKAK